MVGLGPGNSEHLSGRAAAALTAAEVVVGYTTYIELIADLVDGKEVIATGMRREIERGRMAVERAARGQRVAVVSSGDPGVYGMAGLILELLEQQGLLAQVAVEIIPGITAATAAAARLGAPLMLDFCVISLSDLLVPWDMIARRLEAVAAADLVVVLYNPASHRRRSHLEAARQIFLRFRSPSTPVGLVRNAFRPGEEVTITTLADLPHFTVDMLTTVIVGNSTTRRVGDYLVTARGYRL